jgi:hypothetical protein
MNEALALYRHHTGRTTAPTAPFRAATLICGRRGGKTRLCSLVATFLATVPDHSPHLVADETAVVAVLAMNQVALHYIVGLLRSVPALEAMVEDVLADDPTLQWRDDRGSHRQHRRAAWPDIPLRDLR